ncbi:MULTISPECIES: hypothetical protein [Prochlorococcus]|uniref:hypothetical protein n=1 Tax=Prochlorococcus TaxID=1218 RepID=UPI000533ADA3|nr:MULTISPECIES: hypothetical protein [Prochlorococcus]KGG12715.1 hypothetical protein EV05_1933 [Prochlorococcus sp. MIT 0601]
MGQIADALRANLQKVAQSDARSLRALEEGLNSIGKSKTSPDNALPESVKDLLGSGTFEKQTNKTLQSLCKENGVKGFNKLKKAGLITALKEKGVEPPARPINSLSKKELVDLVNLLM